MFPEVMGMASEQAIRALLVNQLGVAEDLIDQVQLIDVALALSDTLGAAMPVYRLRHLRNYHDVLRAARDALCDQLARGGSDCYVRARLRAGHVTVVRVGVLTPSFASALADDLRHAPGGSWLEVSVPDDLDDAAVAALHRRLEWLLGPAAALVVRRASELGPDSPTTWDRMSHEIPRACRSMSLGGPLGPGIAVAVDEEDHPYQRRRFPA